MTSRIALCLLAGTLLLAFARPASAVDELAAKERIGVRIGPVMTYEGLNEAYGDGWDATLFFTEGLFSWLLLDIRLGATYLGEAKDTELDDQLTGTPGVTSNLQNFYFSAGPIFGFPLGGAWTGYASAGLGVYSVSIKFESAIQAFDFSDQHLGANGGFGVSRRVSKSVCIEFNGTVHWFSVDKEARDLYYSFTDGAGNPIITCIAAGVTIDLR